MEIPKDPFILLSFINTKLRDEYPSLTDLCQSMDIDLDQVLSTLATNNYNYDKEQNRFIAKM